MGHLAVNLNLDEAVGNAYQGCRLIPRDDGSKFSTGEKVFSLGQSSNSNTVQSALPPGDPTVAKIGSSRYMYYGARDGIQYATLK